MFSGKTPEQYMAYCVAEWLRDHSGRSLDSEFAYHWIDNGYSDMKRRFPAANYSGDQFVTDFKTAIKSEIAERLASQPKPGPVPSMFEPL